MAWPGLVSDFSRVAVGAGSASPALAANGLASPKSKSFAWPLLVTKVFAGLMSR